MLTSSESTPRATAESAGLAELLSLRRWRTRVVLRNTRNEFAREHPLWVFHGLLMHALPKDAEGKPKLRFFFHPATEALGDRIQKGREYTLDVILPTADPSPAAEFSERLAAHLAVRHSTDRGRNFELVRAGPPELRSLAAVAAENPPPPADTEEVCLEFISPLAYQPCTWRIRN